jgi:O-antigen ligase
MYQVAGTQARFAALILLLVLGLSAATGVLIGLLGPIAFAVLVAGALGWLVIERPDVSLYLMLVLVPLQNMVIFPTQSTLVRYVGMVVFGTWAMQKLSQRGSLRRLLQGRFFLPMIVFLSISGLSVLWSQYDLWATWMFTFLQLALWVILIVDLLHSQRALEIALLALALGNVISAVFAVQQYYFSGPANPESVTRAGGGFGDPNNAAASFLYILPFLFFLMKWRTGWKWLLGVIGIPLLALAIGLTVSRTGIFLLSVYLAYELIALIFRRTIMPKVRFLLVTGLIVAAGILYVPWETVTLRFSDFVTHENSLQDVGGRGILAEWSLGRFTEKPLFGSGLGREKGVQPPAHNLFLEMAVQLGLLGLLGMGWLWLVSWQNIFRARKGAHLLEDPAASGLVTAIGISLFLYLLFSLTISNEGSRPLWLMFALAEVVNQLYAVPTGTKGIGAVRDQYQEFARQPG